MTREKRTIERDCMECGKTIEITIFEDDTYEGGNYFGEFTVPEEDSERNRPPIRASRFSTLGQQRYRTDEFLTDYISFRE